MANIQVFADKQTDKPTGQKLYTPNLSVHKSADSPFIDLEKT